MIADGLSRIAMSSGLAASLSRATDYARSRGHGEVTLEHMLLALCDDPEAVLVLAASNVNVAELTGEVETQLAALPTRAPGQEGELVVASDLRRILEAAAAAARGGRRREINGAIVLAAIVGDGKSAAAHVLSALGLTFEGAIRALQSKPAQEPARALPAPDAEAILAGARERVQSRTGLPARRLPAPGESAHAEPAAEPAANYAEEEYAPPAQDHGAAPPAPEPLPPPSEEPSYQPEPAYEPAAAPDHHHYVEGEAPAYEPPPSPDHGYEPEPPPMPASAPYPPPIPPPGPYDRWTPPPSPRDAPVPPPFRAPPPPPASPVRVGGEGPRPGPPPLAPWPEPERPGGVGAGSSGVPVAYELSRHAAVPPTMQRPGARPVSPRAEIGQLVENIPRFMRVAVPALIEVRIARADVQALAEGLQGGGAAYQHEVMVTKAMSVRLRAPDGGFFIETASPETQWIEKAMLLSADDFASWRWHVTPREKGRRRLQLIISARTVSSDGLAAETALPDQVITVRVRTNYAKAAARWAGWGLAAVIGGLLAKFGEGAFDTIGRMLTG